MAQTPLVLLLLLCVSSALTEPTRYNSSDLSYLSNGIQFPVPASELHNPAVEEIFQDVSEVRWLAELFDHLKWAGKLKVLNETRCQTDLELYVEELLNGTSWAAKMYDSSGRYSGQFFFGNDYWLGSKTLCEELTNPETNPEIPPFPVTFLMAKVRLNINRNLTPVTRQLNVGECLPSSCTPADVRLLLAQDRKAGSTLNVVGIRPVPGDYRLLEDIKFQIVGGVTLVVSLLIFVASLVEIIANKKQKQKVDAELENNNNVDDAKSTKKDQKTGKKPKQSLFLRVILCFSAIDNGKKILNVEKVSQDSIKCIHGLRFFSIAWIIMVHTYLEVFSIGDNKNLRILTERNFVYQTVSNATFSVDTFFFISGLLVTITYFRTAAKKPAKEENTCRSAQTNFFKFVMLVIYRFFRLTPAYLFVLGVNEVILRYLHSYSVFSPAIIDHISCSNFWWRNALYINNFYPQTEFCMLWSWYIANDTQFYLVASVLLLIAVRGEKHLKFAGAAIGVFMVSSWIMTFIIAMKYEYVVRVEEPFALFDQLYDKPWMRIGPYFVGMISGYFLFRVKCQVKLPLVVVVLGWVLSLACLSSLVYGVGKLGLVVPTSAFYASLGHTAWGLSLAWITLACCSGYGGPISALLKFKFFLPLSRLTYCAYLIHPVFMCLSSFVLDGPIHLNNSLVMVIYCGNIVASFVSAFAISLAFEAPIVNLLKIIF
ncbi:nose resistant to fluoxetine protein 6 isoform X1 [Tribolium castaneum]|uniref:Nose resistant to fluoxetine protein 6-like Protein n=1 Tax=Tribolium castaneum TaxID=7070 RepID=D6X413_TRICA|nr:PREDICTED: nose resistant to fluoxetine protein 6 isoform X1 [Tribolium castaneum]EEZ97339.1 Nose resistant to fluoxetine protein 6-like Protein [Tribolium castaneum]|eukprot:XP_008198687.1 PREDICTED: nose resistant to fluoxetine protein 6 isoform X1 [Tribolium castaneum]